LQHHQAHPRYSQRREDLSSGQAAADGAVGSPEPGARQRIEQNTAADLGCDTTHAQQQQQVIQAKQGVTGTGDQASVGDAMGLDRQAREQAQPEACGSGQKQVPQGLVRRPLLG
jgi:hypothetical protein